VDRGVFLFTHLGFVVLRVCEAGRVGGIEEGERLNIMRGG